MPNFRVDPYPERHYAPELAGGLCRECSQPMPAALAGLEDTHPTCDPDWPPMAAASKRATARKRAAQRLAETGHESVG